MVFKTGGPSIQVVFKTGGPSIQVAFKTGGPSIQVVFKTGGPSIQVVIKTGFPVHKYIRTYGCTVEPVSFNTLGELTYNCQITEVVKLSSTVKPC